MLCWRLSPDEDQARDRDDQIVIRPPGGGALYNLFGIDHQKTSRYERKYSSTHAEDLSGFVIGTTAQATSLFCLQHSTLNNTVDSSSDKS